MKDDKQPLMANIPPYGLRMQPKLKALIEEEARKNQRSLNSEIVNRLWESLDARDTQPLKEEMATMSLALEDAEEIRALQAKYIDSMSRENDALRKAGLVAEQLVIELAHAISKAAEGDSTDLQRLVEREKSQPTLKKLVTVWSVVRDD